MDIYEKIIKQIPMIDCDDDLDTGYWNEDDEWIEDKTELHKHRNGLLKIIAKCIKSYYYGDSMYVIEGGDLASVLESIDDDLLVMFDQCGDLVFRRGEERNG